MTLLGKAYDKAVEQGIFEAGLNPQDVAIAIDGLVEGFKQNWLDKEMGHSLVGKVDMIMRLVLSGIQKK